MCGLENATGQKNSFRRRVELAKTLAKTSKPAPL
jgi:hypothetical protein